MRVCNDYQLQIGLNLLLCEISSAFGIKSTIECTEYNLNS